MEDMGIMTDYEWLTKNGLCHKCRKNKTAPHRKFCFDCLDRIREYNAGRYDSEQAKEYQSRRREIYRQKKENGICVRCNKKATHGMYCIDCSLKVKRHNAKTAERRKSERHERGLIQEQRERLGLCLKCGESLSESDKKDGYKICYVCRDKLKEYGKISNENSPWRKSERERYEKNRRWRNEFIQTTIQEAK